MVCALNYKLFKVFAHLVADPSPKLHKKQGSIAYDILLCSTSYSVRYIIKYISSLQKAWSTYHESTKEGLILDTRYKIRVLSHPQSPKRPCNEYIFASSAWYAPSTGYFTQNLDQVGMCSTCPQHSLVICPESFSFTALDLCCDSIVHCIVLLDCFYHQFSS